MKGNCNMQDIMNKPVVYFTGEPSYWMWDEKNEVASLEAVIDHPKLGDCRDVRTSTVKQKFDDGSFETRNTIYKPATQEMQDECNERIEQRRKEMQKAIEDWYNKPFSQTGLAGSKK